MGPYLSTLNYWRYWILGRGSHHCLQLIPREEPTRLQWTALITPRVTESHRKTRLWGGHVRWGWWWWWKGIGKGGRCGDKSNQTALYINKYIKLSRN